MRQALTHPQQLRRDAVALVDHHNARPGPIIGRTGQEIREGNIGHLPNPVMATGHEERPPVLVSDNDDGSPWAVPTSPTPGGLSTMIGMSTEPATSLDLGSQAR